MLPLTETDTCQDSVPLGEAITLMTRSQARGFAAGKCMKVLLLPIYLHSFEGTFKMPALKVEINVQSNHF